MLKPNKYSKYSSFLKKLNGASFNRFWLNMSDYGRLKKFIISGWNSMKPWGASYSLPSSTSYYKRWSRFFKSHPMYNIDKLHNYLSSIYQISVNLKMDFDFIVHHTLPKTIPVILILKKTLKRLIRWFLKLPWPVYLFYRRIFLFLYKPIYNFIFENDNPFIGILGLWQGKFFVYLIWYIPTLCFKISRKLTRNLWIFFLKNVRSFSFASELFWLTAGIFKLLHNINSLSDKNFISINISKSWNSFWLIDDIKSIFIAFNTFLFYFRFYVLYLALIKDFFLTIFSFLYSYVNDWFVSLGKYDRHFSFLYLRFSFLKKLIILFLKKFRYLFPRHFFFNRNYVVGHGDFTRRKQGPRILFKYVRHSYFVAMVNFKLTPPWGINLIFHPKYWSKTKPFRFHREYDPKYWKQLAIYLVNASEGSPSFMMYRLLVWHDVWDDFNISYLKKNFFKYSYTHMWYFLYPFDILHSKRVWVPYFIYSSWFLKTFNRLAYLYHYDSIDLKIFYFRKAKILDLISRTNVRWIKIYKRNKLRTLLFFQRNFIRVVSIYYVYRLFHMYFWNLALHPFIDKFSNAEVNMHDYDAWADKFFELHQNYHQISKDYVPYFLLRIDTWPAIFSYLRLRLKFIKKRKRLNPKTYRLVSIVYNLGVFPDKGKYEMSSNIRIYWRKGWKNSTNFHYFWYANNTEPFDWYLFFNNYSTDSNIDFVFFFI